MRIPIFEELIIHEFNVTSLKSEFLNKKVGQRPMYINMSKKGRDEVTLSINMISEVMLNLNIHPFFPYPLFIITPYILFNQKIPTCKTINNLPPYFKRKSTRLKKKELELLDKCQLLISKINNRDTYNQIKTLNNNYSPTKNLYNMSKENFFYTQIIQSELSDS